MTQPCVPESQLLLGLFYQRGLVQGSGGDVFPVLCQSCARHRTLAPVQAASQRCLLPALPVSELCEEKVERFFLSVAVVIQLMQIYYRLRLTAVN